MKKFLSEFKKFALRGNVMDLAVGVIIGGAFQGIVKSLVDDLISPLIGLVANTDLSGFLLTIGGVEIRYGSFLTAGFGDVGFSGYWTLEIFCVQPVRIYPNVEICQIYYHDIHGEYEPYQSGKDQNNTGIQPSLMFRDFEK